METIKQKSKLYREIKNVLESHSEDNVVFPLVISFCEGMGEPEFRIMIEKTQADFYVDEKGQKWVKA